VRNIFSKKFLYIIIDRALLGRLDPAVAAERAARGGADLIQYRDKLSNGRVLFENARSVLRALSGYAIPLIINDRLDVARAAGAAGVHLGRDDLPVSAARNLAGDEFIIGASARTVAGARRAQEAGADYLGVGPFFPTTTKAGVSPIDHELFLQIIGAIDVPVVAIGGIGKDNLNEPLRAGASGVAVASSIFRGATIEDSVRELKRLVEKTTENTE